MEHEDFDIRGLTQEEWIEKVISIIETENLQNTTDLFNNTLLHSTAKTNDHLEITKYLIESGCAIDAKNDLGQTPLMLAIQNDCEDVVDILLDAGSDIHIQDYLGRSALEMFSDRRWCQINVIQKFITIVERYFPNDNEEIAKIVLDYGWPLMYVVLLGNADVTKLYLQNSKYLNDINVLDDYGHTALHVTVWADDHLEITKYLIESGCTIDVQNQFGKTPLMLAIQNDCEDVVDVLLDAGSDIHIRDNVGCSALEMFNATRWCRTDVIEKFIKLIERDFPDDNEELAKIVFEYRWPLQYVILLGNADVTKLYLQNSEYSDNVSEPDGHGKTALHLAVQNLDVDNVKLLLDSNANMYVQDNMNHTAWFYLCSEKALDGCPMKRLEIMRMLVRKIHNISRNMDDCYYLSEIYGLLATQRQEVIKLLLQTNIDLCRTNFRGQNAVHALAVNGDPGVIEELRNKKFDVNVHDEDLETPLMLAAEFGNARTVEFFLDSGANIEAKDETGMTALFMAFEELNENDAEGCRECVQILLERGANAQVESYDDEYLTIFDGLLEDDNFESTGRVLSHLALQEALGTPITEVIRGKIQSDQKFETYFQSSKQQLSAKVHESLTLFDLLSIVTDREFERYVRNEEFVLKIENFIKEIDSFQYYNVILQKRLKKAVHIAVLKKDAAAIVCGIMQTSYDRFPLIADDIVDYLEQQDMENLIET